MIAHEGPSTALHCAITGEETSDEKHRRIGRYSTAQLVQQIHQGCRRAVCTVQFCWPRHVGLLARRFLAALVAKRSHCSQLIAFCSVQLH